MSSICERKFYGISILPWVFEYKLHLYFKSNAELRRLLYNILAAGITKHVVTLFSTTSDAFDLR